MLYNSWSLTESQLLFVQTVKEMEKNEIKGTSPLIHTQMLYVTDFFLMYIAKSLDHMIFLLFTV